MQNISDFIDWVIWLGVAVIGWFLNRTINKIEEQQKSHETRLNTVERDIAVIGKSVDNNFAALSSTIDNMQTQLTEIKALLIEEIKKDKR